MYFINNIKKIIFLAAILILIIISVYLLRPVKKATKYSNVNKQEAFVLVKSQYTTSSMWQIIGDNNGYYKEPVDASLTGVFPNVKYEIVFSDNTYVCYGNYLENTVTPAGYKNCVYNVNEWDILYPIYHNSIFSPILSKNYLYSFEIQNLLR